MNYLAPHPWDQVAYAVTAIIALLMAAIVPLVIASHCEWVYQATGIEGACGLGAGWILIMLAFLAIAAYAGRELYRIRLERRTDTGPKCD